MRQEWRVLRGSNVAMDIAGTNSFVVVGYPTITVKHVGGFLVTSAKTQLFTDRYAAETPGERTEHDFFLIFSSSAESAGRTITTPGLEGTSGISV